MTVAGNSQTWAVPTSKPYLPGELIAIVGGTGWGQVRNVTAFNSSTNTFTVDRAWDITPASGISSQCDVWVSERDHPKPHRHWQSRWNSDVQHRADKPLYPQQSDDEQWVHIPVDLLGGSSERGRRAAGLLEWDRDQQQCVHEHYGNIPLLHSCYNTVQTPATIQGTAGANIDCTAAPARTRNTSYITTGLSTTGPTTAREATTWSIMIQRLHLHLARATNRAFRAIGWDGAALPCGGDSGWNYLARRRL